MPDENEFWQAFSMTRVVHPPRQTLETFGATRLRYHLISVTPDDASRVRIREGQVNSERPLLITPNMSDDFMEGFDPRTQEFMKSMASQGKLVRILGYGLRFRRDAVTQEVVTDELETVANRVKERVAATSDPFTAVLIGSDAYWEVSLMRFMIDFIDRSLPLNMQEIQEREAEARLQRKAAAGGLQQELDADFRRAAADPSFIRELGAKLQRLGLFEKYEDRFFALMRHRS